MSAENQSREGAGTQMARWSAKALLVTLGVALVGGALWYARAATVPLAVAALVSTQLVPLVAWQVRKGAPRGLAIGLSLVAVLVIACGLAWLFLGALLGELADLGQLISDGADEVVAWLRDNSTWISENEEQIREFLASILPAAKNAAGGLLSGALGTLSLTAQLVSGAVLTFVFLLYLLTGGDEVWRWIQERFSPGRRPLVSAAGVAAWDAAGGYIRGIALVAFIDSAVIGLGMLVIGTPHVGALVLLSFVSLFVPILGAWVSGVVIVLVTLAAEGSGAALVMAVVILAAQQLDSMFVTPLVYQKTVNLHPIVTLSAVIIGTQLLGIVGAFLAVPMVAVSWAVWNALEQTGPAADVPSKAPVPRHAEPEVPEAVA